MAILKGMNRVGVKNTQQGFTIVELLIVIVVIGILAAITIVSYKGVQNRAYEASISADFKNIMQKFEIFKIDNNIYPTTNIGVTTIPTKVAKGAYAVSPTTPTNLTACYSDDGNDIALVALSKSGKAFYMYSTEGLDMKVLSGAWISDSALRCKAIASHLSNPDPVTGNARNYNGYNVNDTTTGPWRAWVGGS